MPVFLSNNESLQQFSYSQIVADTGLQNNREQFLNNKLDQHGAVRSLYVGQREFACVRFNDDKIDIIGSDDATTCHIVLIVDQSSNNCSMCHFDGSDMSEGLDSMLSCLKTLSPTNSNTFNLYVVGGFQDSRKISHDVTNELFELFIESADEFHLKLCVVTKLNDTLKNNVHFPNAYGFGYNLKTQSVFMCNRFVDKGPDLVARSARHFSPNGNMNIFNSEDSTLVIGPFDYEPIQHADQLHRMPDHVLLKYFSTSPEQEPPEFVCNLKKTFQIMVEHPEPCRTYFKDMKPFVYGKLEDGSWQLLDQ